MGLEEHTKTERGEDFWETADEMANYKFLAKIARLRKKGIDIENLLDQLDPEIKRTPAESN